MLLERGTRNAPFPPLHLTLCQSPGLRLVPACLVAGTQRYFMPKKYKATPQQRQKHKKTARLLRPYLQLMRDAKKRSIRSNIEFNLTHEWAKARWIGKCELTQIAFDLTHGKPHAVYHSPTIDRKNPLGGYTQENCRFVLYAVNLFKAKETDAKMFEIANALINNKK